MFQLMYFSQVVKTELSDIEDILRTSQINNQRNQITGVLILRNGIFTQIIEGEKQVVESLFNDRIKKDHRHKNVVRLFFQGCQTRLFPDWKMDFHDISSAGKHESSGKINAWSNLLKMTNPVSEESIRTLISVFQNS